MHNQSWFTASTQFISHTQQVGLIFFVYYIIITANCCQTQPIQHIAILRNKGGWGLVRISHDSILTASEGIQLGGAVGVPAT